MDFDNRIKRALTPTIQPDKGLNESVLRRVKEQEQMKNKLIWRKMVVLVATLVCLVSVSAFAYEKLKGDEVSFWTEYQGDGVIAVHVINSSDKELVFEEELKLMKWLDAYEITPGTRDVSFEGVEIPANGEGVMMIDISGAYDVESLEQPLGEGDWYYLVLTNNHFAFGHDWMVSVDFSYDGATIKGESYAQNTAVEAPAELQYDGELVISEWVWPTESRVISSPYGENEINGYFSDHVNISGEKGNLIYAVTNGIITDVRFGSDVGNYIELTDELGRVIQYGHLDSVDVEIGQNVNAGDIVGKMGKSGMATGVNLFFGVYVDGKPVNPLAELE